MPTKARKKSKAAAKKSAKKSTKIVKLRAKRPAAVANGLPRPSTKPWGGAGRALEGVRILDFTHVQSGPTCTHHGISEVFQQWCQSSPL